MTVYTRVTAEALRAKIYRKSAISHQRGHFESKFQVQRVASHQSFLHGQLGQWMPYKFVPDSFHTGVTAEALRAKIERKSTISHQRGHFDSKFYVEGVVPHQSFFAPIVRPMNALQICPWQFSHMCYGWGATSENISKIGDFTPTRSLRSKILGTRGCPHQ